MVLFFDTVQNSETSILTLSTGAADLARRLCYSRLFLDAARELLNCNKFSSQMFKRHSKKVGMHFIYLKSLGP
jgi:hypothetical protein